MYNHNHCCFEEIGSITKIFASKDMAFVSWCFVSFLVGGHLSKKSTFQSRLCRSPVSQLARLLMGYLSAFQQLML